jgi:hypothetical protein
MLNNVRREEDIEFWKKPKSEEMYMIAGWNQWADAGSVSSGLPEYLVQQRHAESIGRIRPDPFYLFQVPGTHDLMRPVVRFVDGFPESLENQHNDFFYTGDEQRGVVIFRGEEPHMEIERYIAALIQAARVLNVKRIIGLGGVYGELPYDKDRTISCNYSMRRMRAELDNLAVNFSDYHGGASLGSILARRCHEQGMEYVGLYAFVPAYDFSLAMQSANTIRIENDYTAWYGIMRRINYMTKLGFDLSDLDAKSRHLAELVKVKLDELEAAAPQLGLSEYFARLSEEYQVQVFDPLEEVWEDELKRLLNKYDEDDPPEEQDSTPGS